MLKNREHRTVMIRWTPRTAEEWSIFTRARLDAANLWNKLVGMHEVARRFDWKWPRYRQFCEWAKHKFKDISSQTVQQICKDFCDCVFATSQLIKSQIANNEPVTAEYPHKMTRYRDVVYTNQMAVIKKGRILKLSHGLGGNGKLRIRIPDDVVLPGRMMEAYLAYGEIRIVCEIEAKEQPKILQSIGVDLGVNTLIAATDGETAILVSGRELKALNQYRNKSIAVFRSKISKTEKGSRRSKKLLKAKHWMLDKNKRQVRDIVHKATAIVSVLFPNSHMIVGRPFNDAARKMEKKRAQQVGEHCGRKIIDQLEYKSHKVTEIEEFYTSQTCPHCGTRQKCRRLYLCSKCRLCLPRDVVGCVNNGRIVDLSITIPTTFVWVRPLRKYAGTQQLPASSAGTAAQYSNVSRSSSHDEKLR